MRSEPRTGELIAGRYRVGAVLSRGPRSLVVEARDQTLDVDVALKIVAAGLSSAREQLLTARRIADPHVCRVHEVGVDGPLVFLVMELVCGEPLSTVLARPLERPRALDLARQVRAAVGAIHQAGVAHGDLSPEHVLVDRRGRIKVIGFGQVATASAPLPFLADTAALRALAARLVPIPAPPAPSRQVAVLCLLLLLGLLQAVRLVMDEGAVRANSGTRQAPMLGSGVMKAPPSES